MVFKQVSDKAQIGLIYHQRIFAGLFQAHIAVFFGEIKQAKATAVRLRGMIFGAELSTDNLSGRSPNIATPAQQALR